MCMRIHEGLMLTNNMVHFREKDSSFVSTSEKTELIYQENGTKLFISHFYLLFIKPASTLEIKYIITVKNLMCLSGNRYHHELLLSKLICAHVCLGVVSVPTNVEVSTECAAEKWKI